MREVIRGFGLVLLIFCRVGTGVAEVPFVSSLSNHVNKNLRGKGGEVGISVVQLRTGQNVFQYHGDEQLIPASVAKLFTTAAALKLLGGDYRFKTEFFLGEPQQGSGIRNLYVRGHGDPSLIDAKLWEIGNALRARGVDAIQHLVVDDSLFLDPRGALGSNPYQAALGAISLNHNSYELIITPRSGVPHAAVTFGSQIKLRNSLRTVKGEGTDYRVVQTPESSAFELFSAPLTGVAPFAAKTIELNLSGSIGERADAVTVYQTVGAPAQYFGNVLAGVLEKLGVRFEGSVMHGRVPRELREPVYTARSRYLSDILRDLNQYSNNFIAGQIVFALGAQEDGSYSHASGVKRIEAFLRANGVTELTLADGSGLDRRNRSSANALARLLYLAYGDFSISPDLLASLSRFANTGTLKSRKLGGAKQFDGTEQLGDSFSSRANGVWAKTGSLDGVSSLAGYLTAGDGERYAFAIISNGFVSKDFEDRMVKILLGQD